MSEFIILSEVVLHFTRYNPLEIDEAMMAEWNSNFRGKACCCGNNLYLVSNKKIKKLHNELQNMYSQILLVIKSRWSRWVELMAYIGKFLKKFELENLNRRDHLGHLSLVGRLILKWMSCFCENNNERLCSTKIRLVDQLSMYLFLEDCSM
jgi:hypothetical protein